MKKIIVFIISFIILLSSINAEELNYNSASTLKSNANLNNNTYSSNKSGQNSLLINNCEVSLKNSVITKSGDDKTSNALLYGTNSAIVVTDNAIFNLTGGSINTLSAFSNGLFIDRKSNVNIINTVISTSNEGAFGLVTKDSDLSCKNITVKTSGNNASSIKINSGSNLVINSGVYETSGINSPAIYSVSDTKINDATISSLNSQGILLENEGTSTLNNVKLTSKDSNISVNNSNSNKIISLNLYNSNISTTDGDNILVSAANTAITLEDNTFTNKSKEGMFLRAKSETIDNVLTGSSVIINTKAQNIFGNIEVDDNSTLELFIKNTSTYEGMINSRDTAKSIALTLSLDSSIKLTGDSYITSLINEDNENNNIDLNGYSLYVNGEKVSASDSSENKGDIDLEKLMDNKVLMNIIKYIILGVIIFIIIMGYYKNYKKSSLKD